MSYDVVRSPAVPRGTAYLVPVAPLDHVAPLMWRPDPCWPVRHLPEPAATHRQIALDHLAKLLDGLCTSVGLDPDEVWREPRHREAIGRNRLQFMAEERIGLTVHRPDDYSRLVVTS